MPETHGTKSDGTPLTDEMVEAMADQAERGYDVEELRRRRGGRPPMGSAASSVESVRLDPELKRDLLLRATEQHISVSQAIRRAIGQYLKGQLTRSPLRRPRNRNPPRDTLRRPQADPAPGRPLTLARRLAAGRGPQPICSASMTMIPSGPRT